MRVAQSLRALGVRAHDRPVWRRFRRNLSISLGGSALSLAIRLGQTALLTRMLTIDDFGRVLIVLNLFFFLESFVGLRVSDVMYRFFQPLRERGDARAFQGLLLLCLGLSLATGLLVGGGALFASPWAAARFYRDPQLAPLLKIYGCTVLVSAFRDFYEAVLRLDDRFSSVVVPQVAGALLTLVLLAAYFATARGYDLRTVMATYAVGGFVQTVPALVLALRLLRPSLAGLRVKAAARGLEHYRPE
ncbi:MAG: oligosaccharide flippase family protein, partial [Acidobacteria bacterium]|nr:oligosaccharide flippase family protein [Acidobacteriota bacterium]